MGPHSAQVSLESSSSSSSASYGLKCYRPTSERSNHSESFLDARRGATRDQALGQKSTGGAAQTADSGQHLLPRPPTTPRPQRHPLAALLNLRKFLGQRNSDCAWIATVQPLVDWPPTAAGIRGKSLQPITEKTHQQCGEQPGNARYAWRSGLR